MITKEDFRSLAQSPQFISGIYNYCDGWCSRCEFKERCMSYATRQIDAKDSATKDEPVLDHVMRIFTIAGELIEDAAREQGIDLSDVHGDDWRKQDVESILAKQSLAYYRAFEGWLEQKKPTLGWYFDDESTRPILHLASADEGHSNALSLALETVSRLSSLIHVKIVRALWRPRDVSDVDADSYDSNGSGKCALVAIDESIEAWRAIDRTVSGCAELISTLDRIRGSLELSLPDARLFVRPGLDERLT